MRPVRVVQPRNETPILMMFVRFDIHSILGMDDASSYKRCGFGTARVPIPNR
jgi:hypothetical protein